MGTWTGEIRAIDTAPIRQGFEWGPCLLAPAPDPHDSEWTIGRWNGGQWIDGNGFPFSPAVYMLLPPLTEIEAALCLAASDP